MTQDFKQDFTDALEKEGHEYIMLIWRPDSDGLIQDMNICSNIKNLDSEYSPLKNGAKQTKKDLILIAAKQSLNGEFD